MVTFQPQALNHRGCRLPAQAGFLMVEFLVALALVGAVLLPFAYSFAAERRIALASYQRAVAMEIVDGEMEAMVAGEWKAFPVGAQNYTPRAAALKNLPPGRFTLTVGGDRVRLEWQPAGRDQGGRMVREVRVTP